MGVEGEIDGCEFVVGKGGEGDEVRGTSFGDGCVEAVSLGVDLEG